MRLLNHIVCCERSSLSRKGRSRGCLAVILVGDVFKKSRSGNSIPAYTRDKKKKKRPLFTSGFWAKYFILESLNKTSEKTKVVAAFGSGLAC